jgi:hypothetical protein
MVTTLTPIATNATVAAAMDGCNTVCNIGGCAVPAVTARQASKGSSDHDWVDMSVRSTKSKSLRASAAAAHRAAAAAF